MAFRTASTITPTSAKIAAHMFAAPTATSARQANFTTRENTMFCLTMPMHLREMRMALAIWSGSSSIRTMSAASMAASLPIAPIAMPMSARVRTGASLMPSPTNASLPFVLLAASSASVCTTLSPGSSSLRTSSTPSSAATLSATRLLSP